MKFGLKFQAISMSNFPLNIWKKLIVDGEIESLLAPHHACFISPK